jgi:hypothetical protein
MYKTELRPWISLVRVVTGTHSVQEGQIRHVLFRLKRPELQCLGSLSGDTTVLNLPVLCSGIGHVDHRKRLG